VLSLTAKGLTSGEVSAHLEEIYGAGVSKDTICRITDRVIEEMNEWLGRPLEPGRIPSVVANHGLFKWAPPSSHGLGGCEVLEA